MDRLAIEFICVFGQRPSEFVHLAAELGVAGIGIAGQPIATDPLAPESWDLCRDPALLRATREALRETGVRVTLGEGFLILPGRDIAAAEPLFDTLASLGAPRVNAMCIENDRARAIDQFARYAAMAAERGMDACLEYMPVMGPRDLDEALAIVTASGAANARLLLDAMHFYRSGSQAGALAAIDPARIGYAQICDVPMPARNPDYGSEARDERLGPGEGDLPLDEFVAALPPGCPVGLEVPMLSRKQAGQSHAERLRPCIAAARELLAAAG